MKQGTLTAQPERKQTHDQDQRTVRQSLKRSWEHIVVDLFKKGDFKSLCKASGHLTVATRQGKQDYLSLPPLKAVVKELTHTGGSIQTQETIT